MQILSFISDCWLIERDIFYPKINGYFGGSGDETSDSASDGDSYRLTPVKITKGIMSM